MTSRNGSTISYTSYNLPSSISAGSNSSTITYGAYRNRYKQVAVTSGTTETTLYVGGLLEKMTRGSLVKWRHLIHGGNGLAAVYTRRSGSASNTDTAYLHRDHLGSPELLTSHTGALIARPSFGAYGERRDGSDWNGPPSAAELTTLGNYRRSGIIGEGSIRTRESVKQFRCIDGRPVLSCADGCVPADGHEILGVVIGWYRPGWWRRPAVRKMQFEFAGL